MDFSELQDKDFQRMMFPVNVMPDNVSPVDYFKKLQQWKEFNYKSTKVRFNKIFKWIALVYDMNSPFRIRIEDIIQRKVEVAKYVRLFDNVVEAKEEDRNVLLNKDDKVNRMIIAYVRMHRNSKYALVVGLESQFYEDLYTTQSGKKPNKPLYNTQNELEKAIQDLLANDNNQFLTEELLDYVEDQRISNIRPEDIAQLLLDGKKPISEEEIAEEE